LEPICPNCPADSALRSAATKTTCAGIVRHLSKMKASRDRGIDLDYERCAAMYFAAQDAYR
jgi:hypothetical protein